MKRVRLASLLLLLLNGWWWTSPWIWETADLVDLQTKRDNGAGRHGRAMTETFQIVAGNVDLTKKNHAFERIYFLVELCFRDVICDFIIWKSDLIIVDQDDVDEWSEPFAWWCRKLSRYKMAIILKFYVKLFLKISKILVRVPTNAIVALENQLVKCMIYLSTYLFGKLSR